MSIILRPSKESVTLREQKIKEFKKIYLREYFEESAHPIDLRAYRDDANLLKNYRDALNDYTASKVELGSKRYLTPDQSILYKDLKKKYDEIETPKDIDFEDSKEQEHLKTLEVQRNALRNNCADLAYQIQKLLIQLQKTMHWDNVPFDLKVRWNPFYNSSLGYQVNVDNGIFSAAHYLHRNFGIDNHAVNNLTNIFNNYYEFVISQKKTNGQKIFSTINLDLLIHIFDDTLKAFYSYLQEWHDANLLELKASHDYDSYETEVKDNQQTRLSQHPKNIIAKQIQQLDDIANSQYEDLKSKIKDLEKKLKIQRDFIRTSTGTGDFLLQTSGQNNSLLSDCYASLDNSKKAFFLGWLCRHIKKIVLHAKPEGQSENQLSAAGISGYDTKAKSGKNAWDALAGIMIFDTNNIPELVQEILDKLTASKVLIGVTRSSTGSIKNKQLSSKELALYLHFKFGWEFGQDLNITEDEATKIQQQEVSDNAADFEAGYNS